uniref:Palmitoyltransferase n=1 Tax=Sphenodon punctatus TaxID=8508 RepID=A0A8D0G6U5_SPHPU
MEVETKIPSSLSSPGFLLFSSICQRTVPEQLHSRNDLVSSPLHSRVNGWSFPLHSFQCIALLLYTYLALVGFGIYIPLLPHEWKYAAYTVSFFPGIGILFAHHLVTHLVAITIDPADQNVLTKKDYNNPMPVFDRSRHGHVIQNQHCYLCEVDVGPKAKHCSACNKCIADFDHHCKWLNNCVGIFRNLSGSINLQGQTQQTGPTSFWGLTCARSVVWRT